MHRLTLALVALFIFCAGAASADERPMAALDSGQVQGVREGGIAVFKGIPYAAPPVGQLRWAPTAPAEHWDGVRGASKFGAICPQRGGPRGDFGQPQSEDCLFLNVYAPAAAKHAPVMVWIHGGAFRFGSGSQPF